MTAGEGFEQGVIASPPTAAAPNGNGHHLGELALALAKAQAAFPKLVKDQTATVQTKAGGEYKYRYSDLASLLEAIRKPLTDNGLAVVQLLDVSPSGSPYLRTELLHVSGASLVSRIMLADHERPQELGSEITYKRRYALSALVGIASEVDDDGAAAQVAPVRAVPGYYRGRPPASVPGGLSKDTAVIQAEEDIIFGKKAEVDPGLIEQLPEAFRTDTYALEMAIARLMQNRGVTATDEKLALSLAFLDKKSVPDASHMDKAKLYIFLNDPAGVADWRKELAKRKGAAK